MWPNGVPWSQRVRDNSAPLHAVFTILYTYMYVIFTSTPLTTANCYCLQEGLYAICYRRKQMSWQVRALTSGKPMLNLVKKI